MTERSAFAILNLLGLAGRPAFFDGVMGMQELKLNRVYRHFKGKYYLAEDVVRDSETGEAYVLYRQLYGDGDRWIRPLSMFLSEVDREKYPDCGQTYRFALQEEYK